MGKIITYKKGSTGKYCQIKLDNGSRILISLAQSGIKIYKLKWRGLIPSGTIFEISTGELFSEKYRSVREKLTEKSLELDMLDVFKDILLPCKSLEEVQAVLVDIFEKK